MDIGVHALDLCLWLMAFEAGARVGHAKTVFAKGTTCQQWGEWTVPLHRRGFCGGIAHFDNGATLMLERVDVHQVENGGIAGQIFARGGVKWPSADSQP